MNAATTPMAEASVMADALLIHSETPASQLMLITAGARVAKLKTRSLAAATDRNKMSFM